MPGGVIGTAVGTMICPGFGTAAGAMLGTLFSMGADIFYQTHMAPTYDNYFEFN